VDDRPEWSAAAVNPELTRVLEVEAEARGTVNVAEQEAQRIESDAHERAARLLQDATAAQAARTAAARAERSAQGEEEAARIAAEGARACEADVARATQASAAAIEAVLAILLSEAR
jgi:vacuolar-type H+-ATPase subunit H